MKKIAHVLLITLAITWLMLVCAQSATAKPAWQQDWQKTLAAAKQEGAVRIYAVIGPAQQEAIKKGFMAAHGINIEFLSGRGRDLRARILTERQTGLHLADIYWDAAPSMLRELKPVGAIDPMKPLLVLPEVVDPLVWYGGRHLYADKEERCAIALCYFPNLSVVVNTNLVKPEDIKTNSDLLNPKWKGKIVLYDPTIGGPGMVWFSLVSKALGDEFMEKFAKQEPVISRDPRQMVEWVVRRKYSILVAAHHAAVGEFLKAGAPIRFFLPNDVSYAGMGTTVLALINKAPHPNAAKVFLNWILTKDGLTICSKAFMLQSTRLDVPTDHLNSTSLRQPGVVYINSENEEAASGFRAAMREAAKIFGLPMPK